VGESIHGFYDRTRSIVGDAMIEWGTNEPEKTKLNIIQDHLNRPIRATEDAVGWDQILPEDLVGMQGTHGTVR
jgi:hypothetical protein